MIAVMREIGVWLKPLFTCVNNISVMIFVLLFSSVTYAACQQDWIARVVSLQGEVDVRHAGAADWQAAELNRSYCRGDTIRVQANSRAALELHNDTILRLNQNSTLLLSGPKQAASWLDLLRGSLHSISRVPRSLKIKTPFVNAGIEGTEFLVQVNTDHTLVGVIEGKVAVSNEYGRILLVKDQSAVTYEGQAPVLRLDIRPADSVQWSLYYPLLNVAGLQQAEDLLRVGQVDAARALLQGNDSAEGLALRSVIAVARNEKDAAIELAEQAIQANDALAVVYIAKSYALQAQFDLPAAREAAQQAVLKNDTDAIAWSRLAELELSLSELDKGLAAAQRAVELDPNLARTQTLLGFAQLLRYDTAKARQAFERSIKLDSSDPLARLGNGLAIIREGNLRQGRREIEIAASLDTNNAQIRSYLGKAYLEEGRNNLAAEQLALAREMDPKDPTPWLYEALRAQSENRQIKAYHDLQESIERNSNRAVYRSSFALDQDLGVRSAGLGNIYRSIGFDRLALLQGWISVNQNPLNYSSHQLLADAYGSQVRNEFARVNEFYMAQILQPVNLRPQSPQRGELNLGILDGTGPFQPSLNEYDPLIAADSSSFQVQLTRGNNDTKASDITLSGLEGNSSYSAGAYHYNTDGFRENNDQKIDIISQYIQTRLSNDLSASMELRFTDIERGDVNLTGDGSFSSLLRQFETIESVRMNFRKDINAGSAALFSIGYKQADLLTQLNPGLVELGTEADYVHADLAYISVSPRYNIVSGLIYRNNKGRNDRFFLGSTTPLKFNTDYYNAYAYLNYKPHRNLTVTLGGSYDWLRDAIVSEDKDDLLPKLGFIWSPYEKFILRGAYFKKLQAPRVSTYTTTPTLEPSQVAGFNQEDLSAEGEESEFYGLGMDYLYSRDYSIGTEIYERKANPPITNSFSIPPAVVEPEWIETTWKLYLHGLINEQIAFKLEYFKERFKRDTSAGITGAEVFTTLRTDRVPLTLSYFFNANTKLSVTGSYYRQRGDYLAFTGSGFGSNQLSDDFWVADFSAEHSLPGKQGIVALDIKNIFDRSFLYHETDPTTPVIMPERYIGLRLGFRF